MPVGVAPLLVPGDPEFSPQPATYVQGSPAFPATSLLDDFNRADGGLGGSWLNPAFGGTALTITSNQLAVVGASSNRAGWNNSFLADQEVWVTVNAIGVGTTIRLVVRMRDPNSTSGYTFRTEPGTGLGRIETNITGGSTIAAFAAPVLKAGDSIGLRAVGSLLSVFYQPVGADWREIFHLTDGTYASAGFIGIMGDSATNRFDNFGGGSVIPDDPFAAPPLSIQSNPLAPILRYLLGRQDYFQPVVGSGGDITILADVGSLSLTSDLSAVLLALAPAFATLTLTAGTNTPAEAMTPSIGSLSLAGGTNTPAEAMAPSIAQLTLSAPSPTLQVQIDGTVNPSQIGVLNLTGGSNAPAVSIAESAGTLTLSGQTQTVAEAMTPPIGVLVLGSDPPAIISGLFISETVGTLTLSGQTQTVSASVAPSPAVLSLSGGANTTSGGSSAAGDDEAPPWLYFLN